MSASLLEKSPTAQPNSLLTPHPPLLTIVHATAPAGLGVASSPLSMRAPSPTRASSAPPPNEAPPTAPSKPPPQSEKNTVGGKSRTARFIAPELRAMALVVSDVDGRQFPELDAGPGRPAPAARALERVTTEIHDGVPLTAAEFRLFRAAYAECRQHLGGVSAALMASGSRYGDVLTLTTRIEALCADCHVALFRLFPNLKDVHELILSLSDRGDEKRSQQQRELLDKLLVALCDLLTRAISAVERFSEERWERQRTAAAAERRAEVTHTAGTRRKASASVRTCSAPTLIPSAVASGARNWSISQVPAPPPLLPPQHSLHGSHAGASSLALSDGSQAEPAQDPTRPPLYAEAAASGSDAPSPRSLFEIPTLHMFDAVSKSNGPRRAQGHHVADERSPTRAGQSRTGSGRCLLGMSGPLVPPEADAVKADNASYYGSGPDEEGAESDISDDTDLDALDMIMGEAATPAAKSTNPASEHLSTTKDVPEHHQRRVKRAAAKLEAHQLYQTHFLLCEDPAFLGASAATRPRHTPAGDNASDHVDMFTTRTDGATPKVGCAEGQHALPFHTNPPNQNLDMASFTALCAAHRSAAARAHYDSRTPHRISRAVAYAALLATVPLELARELCAVNALLRVHYAHLQWCAEAFAQEETMRFRVADCLGDLSMQKVWSSCLGESCAACTVEQFTRSGAMDAFPTWARRAIGCAARYDDTGVVSAFSLLRVLRVWGPLLLLDRNIVSDLRSGVLNLSETYASVWPVFARRTDAMPGDYVVCLTEEPGEVRLVVLRAARARRTSRDDGRLLRVGHLGIGFGGPPTAPTETDTDTLAGRSRLQSCAVPSVPFDLSMSTRRFTSQRWLQHRGTLVSMGSTVGTVNIPSTSNAAAMPTQVPAPSRALSFADESAGASSRKELVTTSYRVAQETGAWRVEGLSRESFETISDACAAFPTILRRAVGHVYVDEEDENGEDSNDGEDAADSLPKGTTLAASWASAPTTAATNSALHRSCFRNNAAYVRTLIDCGATIIINSAVVDPSVSPDFCWTPLLCAVNNPNADPAEVVELLLQHGADVHYRDDAGCTALYYAIANGYAGAAAALLAHCPTLGTSPGTCPLFVAVGAHLYHPYARDSHRLAQVLPSHAMLAVICRYSTHYAVLALVAQILQDKIHGVDREPRFWERHVVREALQQQSQASCGRPTAGTWLAATGQERTGDDTFTELRTPEQQEALARCVHDHTMLCELHRLELGPAMRVVYARCYWLSWQNWLADLERIGTGHAAGIRKGAGGDAESVRKGTSVYSRAATGRLERLSQTQPRRGSAETLASIAHGGEEPANVPSSRAEKGRLRGGTNADNETSGTAREEQLTPTHRGGDPTAHERQRAANAPAPNSGLLWYQPRDLRYCLAYPPSVLPVSNSTPGRVEVESVEESKGETATAALIRALAARPAGVFMSQKLHQREERRQQARRSVAEVGATLIEPEE